MVEDVFAGGKEVPDMLPRHWDVGVEVEDGAGPSDGDAIVE